MIYGSWDMGGIHDVFVLVYSQLNNRAMHLSFKVLACAVVRIPLD